MIDVYQASILSFIRRITDEFSLIGKVCLYESYNDSCPCSQAQHVPSILRPWLCSSTRMEKAEIHWVLSNTLHLSTSVLHWPFSSRMSFFLCYFLVPSAVPVMCLPPAVNSLRNTIQATLCFKLEKFFACCSKRKSEKEMKLVLGYMAEVLF